MIEQLEQRTPLTYLAGTQWNPDRDNLADRVVTARVW